MPPVSFNDILIDVAFEQRWDDEVKMIHLLGFIEHSSSANKVPNESDFLDYLRAVADEENAFNKDEEQS